jgi:hypothetical protein
MVIVALKNALQYHVVVVAPSSGAAYEPQSKVNNSAQAVTSGWPIGTPIRIAVPPGIDPQTTVDQWRSGSIWRSRSALNPRTWFAFKKFRSDPANDYKKSYGAIYDAYGNFEFGATGAAASSACQLQRGISVFPRFPSGTFTRSQPAPFHGARAMAIISTTTKNPQTELWPHVPSRIFSSAWLR